MRTIEEVHQEMIDAFVNEFEDILKHANYNGTEWLAARCTDLEFEKMRRYLKPDDILKVRDQIQKNHPDHPEAFKVRRRGTTDA